MSELSMSTKALLEAAKAEGPSAAARAKIWSGVSTATKAGGAAAGASSSKMLATGTLFGSAVTVGLAMMLMHVGPVTAPPARAASHVVAPAPVLVEETPVAPKIYLPVKEAPRAKPVARPRIVREVADLDDALMREASLVAEARSALVRGDAKGALQAIGATRSFSPRHLEPEELSIEAQALRALGKGDEASGATQRLKTEYPDHALAR